MENFIYDAELLRLLVELQLVVNALNLRAEKTGKARSCNHCCSGKAIRITYSECVFVALGIKLQCACAILSSVACPSLHYFSTLSHTWHAFGVGGVTEHKMCALIFSTTFV